MNYGQIDLAIQNEMKLDPGLIYPSERLRFVNEALADLGSNMLLTKSAVLPVVDRRAAYPADFLAATNVYVGNRRLSSLPVGAASFEGYTLRPDGITLYSDLSEVTLDYVYTPAPVPTLPGGDADATVVPDIPARYHELLVLFAVMRAHNKNGNAFLSGQYRSFYYDGRTRFIAELTARRNSEILTIREV